MGRVEKFRRKRLARKRYLAAVFLTAAILVSGISAVDYAVNFLVAGHEGFGLVSVDSSGTSLDITVMNHKIHINTKYINRDFRAIKSKLSGNAGFDMP